MDRLKCLFLKSQVAKAQLLFSENIQELQDQTHKGEDFIKPHMTNVLSIDSASSVYTISNHGSFSRYFNNVIAVTMFLICAITATVNMKITHVGARGERGLSKIVIDADKTESCAWHWWCQYVLYVEDLQIAKILNVS